MRLEMARQLTQKKRLDRWILLSAALLATSLLPVIVACAEPPPPATPIPPATPLPAPTVPPPTDEQRRIQTPMKFGNNTRIVYGELHVWHIPTCPPVPPATWVAPIILTDLRSGSHMYLNKDGSIRGSPAPSYRSPSNWSIGRRYP